MINGFHVHAVAGPILTYLGIFRKGDMLWTHEYLQQAGVQVSATAAAAAARDDWAVQTLFNGQLGELREIFVQILWKVW